MRSLTSDKTGFVGNLTFDEWSTWLLSNVLIFDIWYYLGVYFKCARYQLSECICDMWLKAELFTNVEYFISFWIFFAKFFVRGLFLLHRNISAMTLLIVLDATVTADNYFEYECTPMFLTLFIQKYGAKFIWYGMWLGKAK